MRILLFACTALIFAFSLWTKPASANTSLTFSVKPNFPANQVSSTKGYYHFTIKPDESYELSFVMTNTTTKKQTVYITPMNGLSSPSGGTQYIDKLETPNSWLLDGKMAVASLIDIQNSVTLKPHESKTVSFTVKSPAKVSSGTLLGGLHFSTNETTSTQKQEDEKKDVSFVIKNQVAFVLGLQMDYAQPESIHFTIEDPKVDLIPSTPLLLVPMTNSQATLTENIEGKYEVFDHNEQLIFEGAFGPFKMAPKTKIHYPINWNNELFKPGKYRFVLNGSVSGETFRHISDFKIQTENVKEYHELTGFKKPIAEYFPWYIWLFFGLFGTGLLYAGLWLGKRKRSDS